MRDITHVSLFSGIGGLDIAAEMAGFKTIGQCEYADYPYRVLCKHWPHVEKWRDIRTLTGESFNERTDHRAVDVISGGFPCQPFSVAGKQLRKKDERYLWPEMLRVIRELTPSWVIAENVPGILRIAGDTVCQDLEREGFDVGIFSFEAAAVGAPHRRERAFFVANARSRRFSEQDVCCQQPGRTEAVGTSKVVAFPDNQGLQIGRYKPVHKAIHGEIGAKHRSKNVPNTNGNRGDARRPEPTGQQREARVANGSSDVFGALCRACGRNEWWGNDKEFEIKRWWTVEPGVGRVAHGVPNRVDKLRCLGNAVVPMQAYPLFAAIAEIERGAGCA